MLPNHVIRLILRFIRSSESNIMRTAYLSALLLFFCGLLTLSAQNNCGIFYITPTGSGVGTAQNPCDLTFALQNSTPQRNILRLAVGKYTIYEALTLTNNIHLEGGFDPNTWQKSNTKVTRLYRTNQNPESNPLRLVGINAQNIANFSLRELTIEVQSADTQETGHGCTLYGIYLNGCSDYHISRCKIITGNATDGATPTPTPIARNGANGLDGGKGCRQCDEIPNTDYHNRGGIGGNAWSNGQVSGGKGGNGGTRGLGKRLSLIPPQFEICPPENIGIPAEKGTDGGQNTNSGGASAFDRDWRNADPDVGIGCDALNLVSLTSLISNGVSWLNSCPTDAQRYIGQPGQNGRDGSPVGRDGFDGKPDFNNGYFIPANGADGGNGQPGSGGGGGGGGGAVQNVVRINEISAVRDNWGSPGAGGGGGGEGGEGGYGGKGGQGGGGNFGIFVWNNGANGYIRTCEIQLGNVGKGTSGLAGSDGGKGGQGGKGGFDCNQMGNCAGGCEGGRGGNGGSGGNGARGGKGGNGQTGIRQNFYQNTDGEPISAGSFNANFLPAIELQYTGYTNSEATLKVIDPNLNSDYAWETESGTQKGTEIKTTWNDTGFQDVILKVDGIGFTYTGFAHITKAFQEPNIQFTPDQKVFCLNDGLIMDIQADRTFPKNEYEYRWEVEGPPGFRQTGLTDQFTVTTMPLVGTYTFKAVVIHPCIGRSDTVTKAVEVIQPLTPSINLLSLSGDQVCEGAPIRFRSEVQQAGEVYTIEYLQGNTVLATQTQVGDIEFANNLPAGEHTFSARLIPRTTCLSIPAPILSNNLTIKVNPKPRLSCTNPPAVNLGQDINFQTIVSQGKAPFTYEIDLGNGQKLNGSSATMNLSQKARYGSAGTFSAVVKVTDANGCFSECTVTVTVNPTSSTGSVDFQATTPTEGCESVTVTFISSTTGSQYQWDFGNGKQETTNVATANHTYTVTIGGEQIFDVSLTVLDNNGSVIGTKTIKNMVKVYQKPTAVIQRSNIVACANEPILFSNGGKSGISYRWNFGDGTTSEQSAFLHQYKNPGTYTVHLTVIGLYNINNKCQATDQITVIVNAKPDADFSADKTTVCIGDAVTFTPQIITNGSTIQICRWGLGDRQAQIGNPLSYTYWNTGTYTVQLNVITTDGCTTLIEKKDYIKVETRPEVSMDADGKKLTDGSELEVQAGEAIAFKALIINADAVRWEENGKVVSSEREPSLTFNFAGQPIPLKLTAVKGSCEEAVTVFIKVQQSDAISIPNVFSPNGDGVNDIYNIILHRPARFDLEIKDRWGTEVYKGNESSAGWNGGYNNKLSAPCPEGAYVYYLHLSYTNSKNQPIELYYSGTIYILR